MKRIIPVLLAALASVSVLHADDRPVSFNQLPDAAQSFISMNFPEEKIAYATVDDDFIRPDFQVSFESGLKMQFEHDGELEKIERRSGIPSELVPIQICEYVKRHYPDAFFIEYEIDRNSYEVKLSNGLELKFGKNYNLIEIDD